VHIFGAIYANVISPESARDFFEKLRKYYLEREEPIVSKEDLERLEKAVLGKAVRIKLPDPQTQQSRLEYVNPEGLQIPALDFD
jgi:hypothetical protein